MPREISIVEVLTQLALRKSGADEAAQWFTDLEKAVESASSDVAARYLATASDLREASDISQYFFQTGQVESRTSRLTPPELMTKYVLKKCAGVEAAACLFHGLHQAVCSLEQLRLMFTPEDILEARTQILSIYDEALAAKGGVGQGGFSKVGLIVRHILQACESIQEADALFASLEKTIGRPLQYLGGGGFTVEQVREAWLRCAVCYSEQEALAQGRPQACRGASSESESEDLDARDQSNGNSRSVRILRVKGARQERGRRVKGRTKGGGRVKISSRGDNEASGDDMGSGDDLSGEEQVDDYEEVAGGAALLADLGVSADSDEENADNYPAEVWRSGSQASPGTKGFNKRATAIMQRCGVGLRKKKSNGDKSACPEAQPHQEVVKFLMHPKSPISRLLVDHPTGSGKTREMILVLDNFFYDPRPKVPIFPRDTVCRNFYTELLRWPSRYRDYFCCERPKDAAIASGCNDWRKRRFHMWDFGSCKQSEVRRLCHCLREVLEMKGMSYMGQMRRSLRADFKRRHPGEPIPLAPLRAISYVSAGGSFTSIIGDQPASALMKVGYRQGCGNVYTNKVVLLDEAHNLVRSETRYAGQLRRLQELLMAADDIVLVGFTGTPILDKPDEGRKLLDVIKGRNAPESDEGFLSSFPARPRPLFPESLPRGVPDGILTTQRIRELVRKVELSGDALRVYEMKRRMGLDGQRLRNYCNMSVFHGSFHDGKSGCKSRVLANPMECCPKLWEAAKAVAASTKKAVVLTGRTSGYFVMLALLQNLGLKHNFKVATMDELAEFNHASNLKGQSYRVLVANTTQCSEGISFFAVRRLFMTDLPDSPSQLVQQVGRALRLFGHKGLPEKEQTVTSYLYVSCLPRWMRSPLSFWAMSAQRIPGNGHHMERVARRLSSQLKRAGFTDLAKLKAALDKHVKGRACLTSEGVISFLEKNGLWEEVQSVKLFEKREAERIMQGDKHEEDIDIDETLSVIKTAYIEAEATRPNARVRKVSWKEVLVSRLKELRKNELVGMVLRQSAPNINAALDGAPFPSGHGAEDVITAELQVLQKELTGRKANGASTKSNPLVHALQTLHAAASHEDEALSRPQTADEAALRHLAMRSREFAPALASLRSCAVDREMFAHLAEKFDEDGDEGCDLDELDDDDDEARQDCSREEDADEVDAMGETQEEVNGESEAGEEELETEDDVAIDDHLEAAPGSPPLPSVEETPAQCTGRARLNQKTRMSTAFAMRGTGYPRLAQKTRKSMVFSLHEKLRKKRVAADADTCRNNGILRLNQKTRQSRAFAMHDNFLKRRAPLGSEAGPVFKRPASASVDAQTMKALGELEKTSQELAQVEMRVAEISESLLDSNGVHAPSVKIELAQLEAQAKKLESKGIDDVYTGSLESGRQMAKDTKKSILSRMEQLYMRIDSAFVMLRRKRKSR